MYGIPTTPECQYLFAFAYWLIAHGSRLGTFVIDFAYSRCPV